ncbi:MULTISPECIES: LysR family transcriptional regulator [unclassified Halomonas]|uniref:LysR family transcriptional regulator n=1 Tax=unclassified Halomonas TaxID=2609666 RepID=UPI00209FFC1B|nr:MULTISPECIES: LysR family transcriptional regulator [unclassified Halomonas]MCP1313438.1 LysR family transcriptional regulator [Halomonas sp. 707D7]MCP1327448.1 LysR family transcriptional regulator [Halomonas sp. 707D4]
MELSWLEDFAALAEHKSFVRAAKARHVTQPAFSRRIRALEQWMGVALFARTPQGTTLTEAGRQVQESAAQASQALYALRARAQEAAGHSLKTLQFAATHSLSFTFFPRWIRRIDAAPVAAIQLHSDTMAGCERLLMEGKAHFLLSHRDPLADSLFPAKYYESCIVGEDKLVALVGRALKQRGDRPFPYLAYSRSSGLGRIVEQHVHDREVSACLLPAHFTSHLAAVLMSMALEDKGLAWLPESLAEQEIEEGRLVRAFDGGNDIPLEIHIVKPRSLANGFADSFWSKLSSAR